jgi:hypothetical protein
MIDILLAILDQVHPYFIYKPVFKLNIEPLWKLRNTAYLWN